MIRLRAALLACLVGVGVATAARAQIMGRAYEVSGQAGAMFFDPRSNFDTGPLVAGSLGWRYAPRVSFELSGMVSKTTHHPDDRDAWFSTLGADARFALRDPGSRIVPFVLGGIAYARSRLFDASGVDDLDRGAPSVAIGTLVNVADNQRLYLRLQVRDTWFKDRNQGSMSNDISPTVGLTWVFGGKSRDSDSDGIRDWLDKCPETPLGAKVDANGCPIDSDGDGVFDGLDQCEHTPKGCVVDKQGCPVDSDGDGVCDGLDKCPDTPKGAQVDANGCPIDSDGDGVFDGIDKCPGTPKGCTVDSTGCSTDSDGDGVCDALDQCVNTPPGVKVDQKGCPFEISDTEIQLLDVGLIQVGNINFDTGKATLKGAESDSVIKSLGEILVQYPMLKIEIGGYTDNTGTKKKNEALSKQRADAVYARMKALYAMLPDSQFVTQGYGPANPVASNSTKLGRAKNRRVEFKVLNTENLRIEREKRHYIKKDEAPAGKP